MLNKYSDSDVHIEEINYMHHPPPPVPLHMSVEWSILCSAQLFIDMVAYTLVSQSQTVYNNAVHQYHKY